MESKKKNTLKIVVLVICVLLVVCVLYAVGINWYYNLLRDCDLDYGLYFLYIFALIPQMFFFMTLILPNYMLPSDKLTEKENEILGKFAVYGLIVLLVVGITFSGITVYILESQCLS